MSINTDVGGGRLVLCGLHRPHQAGQRGEGNVLRGDSLRVWGETEEIYNCLIIYDID